MKKLKNTKSALIASILVLSMCFTMLIGTTFAWFTDSVTSSGNVIKSGKLDVELYWADGKEDPTAANWNDASKGALYTADQIWEPGYTDAKHIKVANEGTLALKYQLTIVPNGEVSDLADVIDVYYIEGGAAVAARTDLEGVRPTGTLRELINKGISRGTLTAGANYTATIVLKMQEDAGNEHQELSIGSDFSIQLIATQVTYEEDSFGNSYDGATEWYGDFDYSWYDEDATELEIGSAEQLAALAALVNGTAVSASTYSARATAMQDSFSGKTITLTSDIDLANIAWTPIGQTGAKQFAGSLDGNGKTIYNLYINNTANTSEYGAAGLFGWVEQHSGSNSIKNLTIDGVKIASHRYSGAIAGWINIPVTDCTVKNVNIDCTYYNEDTDGTKVGALVGMTYSDLINNTVDTAVLTAYGDIGGLAGVAQTNSSVDGNTVKDVTITYSSDKKSEPGEIVSTRVNPVMGTNTAENITFVKSVVVEKAEDLAATLTSEKKNLVVTLTEDIDIPISSLGQQTGGSGEYKLGGEDTETITIDLNGYKMNITTNYWSAIGAKNDDAVFTIKNGTMTSSQATGTWNSYDLTFANCNYVIENVVFDKAIAFTNANKSVSMTNVTINETHDYYALWISAKGQNVEIDGLTVNSAGRGIKIDEEYVNDSVAKVTLNVSNAVFNTNKKAAIVVKSAKGADITLSNVNIDNTIDTLHTVWVDEDAAQYADLVTVSGGEKANEGEIAVNTEDLQSKIDAAASGTTIYLASVEFHTTINMKSGITLVGIKGTVVDCINLNGADNVTLKNIEFDAAGAKMAYDGKGNQRYHANIISGDVSKNGKGTINLVIDGCIFGGTFANGGMAIAFNDQGRGSGQSGNITIKNCTFETTGGYVDIYTYYSGYGEMIIEGNTFASNVMDMPIYLGRYQSNTPVVVKGNVFENVSQEQAMYIQAHSASYNPSFDATDNTFNG